MMSDMLANGVAWLHGVRAARFAMAALYIRDGRSVSVNVTAAQSDYEIADETGATVGAVASDFLVTADELVIDGDRIEPDVGDRILIVDGSAAGLYEVLNLGGAGCARRSDPFGTAWRVHARLIEPA